MVVILITVLAQNNMPSKCFITFLNTTVQTERSDSNPRLQPRCLRSSHTSLLRRKVAKLYSDLRLCQSVLLFRDGPSHHSHPALRWNTVGVGFYTRGPRGR